MQQAKSHLSLELNRPINGIQVQASQRVYLNDVATDVYPPNSSAINSRNQPVAKEIRIDEEELQRETTLLETLFQNLIEQIRLIDQRRAQALQEQQQLAIELAIAVASHLTQTLIEEDHFGIEEMMQSALERFKSAESIRMTLNPDDLDLMERRLAVTTSHQELRNLVIKTDPSLERGSFLVEDGQGTNWLSSVSLRLSEIRKHWLEELDAAQVERRQTQGTNQTLRRFPDRRETA